MIGALMNQEMTVDGFLHGEDALSTMNALNQIGAGITVDENGLVYLCKRNYIFQNIYNFYPGKLVYLFQRNTSLCVIVTSFSFSQFF